MRIAIAAAPGTARAAGRYAELMTHPYRSCAAILLLAASGCAQPAPTPPPAVQAPVPPAVVPLPAPIPVAAPVDRTPVALCGRGVVQPAADGRLFNHFRYRAMPATALTPAPTELGGDCRVQPALLPDLSRLLAAANADPAVAGSLHAVSCHRPEPIQANTFCGGIGPDGSASLSERAWSSAPPGFSEHATGYVIDFGSRAEPACDAEGCFGNTAAGRWLRANAPRYGFELSFPAGNRQGVKWEPWHWRWVGTNAAAPGAAWARETFRAARLQFPAVPAAE